MFASVLIGEDGAAVVDQAAVADVLEEVAQALSFRGEGVESRTDLCGVGSTPMRVQTQEDDGDEKIAKHGAILACEDGQHGRHQSRQVVVGRPAL